MARVVFPDCPHHITQRGNRRLGVFLNEDDYLRYLELLQQYSRRFELGIAGYCLMPNHIHVIGEPHHEDSIARTFKHCHGVFATEFNRKYDKNGHLWQGRPYSCALDEGHAWAALRYVERNPVRAKIVGQAEDYRWSSAAAHCGLRSDSMLTSRWPQTGIPQDWRSRLAEQGSTEQEQRIRKQTYSGRPCGDEAFANAVRAAKAFSSPEPKKHQEADAPRLLWEEDEEQK